MKETDEFIPITIIEPIQFPSIAEIEKLDYKALHKLKEQVRHLEEYLTRMLRRKKRI